MTQQFDAIFLKDLEADYASIPAGAGAVIWNNGGVLKIRRPGEAVQVLPTPDSSGQQAQAVSYSGTPSMQILAPDLTLGAAAGKNHPDTAHLAAVMGHVLGDALTKTGVYLAGLIGKYTVTGAKGTHYPAGGVLGIIGDLVTEADGAFVAVIDGDSGVTKAGAAFKARARNSTVGSGFDFGVDLHDPAADGYNALAILKADLRLSNEVCVLNGAGAPVDGVAGTGAGFAGPGSLYVRTSNGIWYSNTNTKASPTWTIVGTQA